jgi:hypothetical protein
MIEDAEGFCSDNSNVSVDGKPEDILANLAIINSNDLFMLGLT